MSVPREGKIISRFVCTAQKEQHVCTALVHLVLHLYIIAHMKQIEE